MEIVSYIYHVSNEAGVIFNNFKRGVMTVQSIADVKTNFPEADFWIIRKGAEGKVGTPVEQFEEQHIGVRVIRTDLVLPKFFYYAVMYLHQKGYFRRLAKGTLSLKHITVNDVKSIRIG